MSGLKQSLTVTLEKTEGLQRVFKAIVSANFINEKTRDNISSLASSVQIPGFRPGKVPAGLIEKRYGAQVLSEVLEEVVNETCDALIKDQNIRPALQPQIQVESFEKDKDLILTLSTEILPEIKLVDFATFSFEKLVAEPSEKQVQEQIELESKRASKVNEITQKDEVTIDGDFLFGQTTASLDGKDLPELKNDNAMFYLDAERSPKDMYQSLLGMKIGSSTKFKTILDDKSHFEALRGKEIEYHFTLQTIKRLEKREINDALAEEFGFDSLEAWKTEVKEYLKDSNSKIAREIMKHDLLHKIEESHSFELPKGLIDLEYDAIVKEILKERGIEPNNHTHVHDDGTVCDANHHGEDADAKKMHEQAKLSDEDQKKYKDLSVKRVKVGLILAEVSVVKEIKIGDGELRRALSRLASQYPGSEKKVIEFYTKNPEALNKLKAPLLEEKVVDFILAMAQISDKNVSYEVLIKAQEDADNHC